MHLCSGPTVPRCTHAGLETLATDSINFSAFPSGLRALSVQVKLYAPADVILERLVGAIRHLPVLQVFMLRGHNDIQPLPLQQVMGALCNGAVTRIALNRCGIGGTSIECALPQHLRLFDLTGNHDIILAQWTARMAELQRCIISTDADVARDGARCDMNVFKGEAVFAPPIDCGQYNSLLAPQLNTTPC